jgi:hypothetical protein
MLNSGFGELIISQFLFMLIQVVTPGLCFVMKMETQVGTHHKPPGSQYLLACDGMDDGEVTFCADDYQDEDGGCVTETVHELVHLTQRVPEHPAATYVRVFTVVHIRNVLGLYRQEGIDGRTILKWI